MAELHDAARAGDLDRLRELLAAGARVEARDEQRRTPLMAAAAAGQEEAVRLLLGAGARVKAKAPGEMTPLLIAASAGHPGVVRLLLEAGAPLDASNMFSSTALHLAAAEGHTAVARLLVAAGAPLEARNGIGATPLVQSAAAGHVEVIRALIELGADFHQRYCDMPLLAFIRGQGQREAAQFLWRAGAADREASRTLAPLMKAAEAGDLEAVRACLAQGIDPGAADRRHGSRTPLMAAAERGHRAVIEALLVAGADPNAADRADHSVERRSAGYLSRFTIHGGWTALSYAAASGRAAVIDSLLRSGAAVDPRDAGARTPLYYAAQAGRLKAAQALLAAGADPNAAGAQKDRPLHQAAFGGHVLVVRALVRASADVNALNGEGYSPLYAAAYSGKIAMVRLLLKAGAALDGGARETPLSAAISRNRTAIAQLLLDHGADPNGKNAPLVQAAAHGRTEIARLLLDRGAHLEPQSARGMAQSANTNTEARTPLHFAAERGHADTVRLLLERGASPDPPGGEEIDLPLRLAVRGGSVETVQVLLQAGADPGRHGSDGATPLTVAAELGNVAVLRLLLTAGAEPDLPEATTGRTPLMAAAWSGQAEAARILLRSGAAVAAKDQRGSDALALAADQSHRKIVTMLRRAGAGDAGLREKALRDTAARGDAAAVRRLIQEGVDVNTRDAAGHSALLLAAAGRHREVADALLEAGAAVDPGVDAVLEALRFPEQAQTPAFQAAVRWVTDLCGVEPQRPEALHGLVVFDLKKQIERRAAEREAAGERNIIARLNAQDAVLAELLEQGHAPALERGFLLVKWKYHPVGSPVLLLAPTANKYAVLAAVGTNACNYDMDTLAIITWLQDLEREQPFDLTGCGYDTLEGRFTTEVQDARALAERMYRFCPDIVDQGTETVARLARELRRDPRLYFWWD